MRHILAGLALLIAVGVGGCVTTDQSLLVGGASLTKTIDNPVGREQMAAVESGYRVAVVAAVTYRRYCFPGNKAVVPVPAGCQGRGLVVARMQAADKSVRAALLPLRRFVRENDQISALSAFRAAQTALADYQAIVASNKVN